MAEKDFVLFERGHDNNPKSVEFVIFDPAIDRGRSASNIAELADRCAKDKFLSMEITYTLTTIPASRIGCQSYYEASVDISVMRTFRRLYEDALIVRTLCHQEKEDNRI